MKTKSKWPLAIAGAVAAGGAIAVSFEGRLVCDQDPRFAVMASCVVQSSNDSTVFGWGEPLHITLYGSSDSREMASQEIFSADSLQAPSASGDLASQEIFSADASDAMFVTEYIVDESTGNVVAIGDTLIVGGGPVFSSNQDQSAAGGA